MIIVMITITWPKKTIVVKNGIFHKIHAVMALKGALDKSIH